MNDGLVFGEFVEIELTMRYQESHLDERVSKMTQESFLGLCLKSIEPSAVKGKMIFDFQWGI